MNKHTAMSDATKRALVNAFCEACIQKPIEKITVLELVEKTGCNRGTFYHHFKDIHALITYIENIIISNIHEGINKNNLCDDVSESFVESIVDTQIETAYYMSALLGSSIGVQFSERLKSDILPIYMQRHNISETDKKTIYVLDFHFSGINAVISRWFNKGKDISSDELIRLIKSMMLSTQNLLAQVNES